jgi:pilus assembly protein CpaF
LFEQILAEENIVLSRPNGPHVRADRGRDLGLWPAAALLEDETITEIMVNGAKNIYVERAGKIHRVPDHL